MYLRALSILVSCTVVVTSIGCVETEVKRTTKKVDASDVQIYQIDMSQPRLRLALDIPDSIEVNIKNMLFVEVDDGEHRYGFGGNVFAPDTTDTAGLLYAPWVNTPDSGELVLAFKLAYETGAVIVSDRMTVSLRPEWFWEVEFGVMAHDPCPQWADIELCRTYSLPRDVESSGDGQLYLAWRGASITPAKD
jgi:hypothetical protein